MSGTGKLPTLSSLQAGRRYAPGDRLIARTGTLDTSVRKRMRDAVIKFVGEPVRVLVWDALSIRLYLHRQRTAETWILASPENYIPSADGTASLDVACIHLQDGDILAYEPIGRICLNDIQKKQLIAYLQDWAGMRVEIMPFARVAEIAPSPEINIGKPKEDSGE